MLWSDNAVVDTYFLAVDIPCMAVDNCTGCNSCKAFPWEAAVGQL